MTISHPVITDVGTRGNPTHESSVVKVLAGAERATSPGRSIKRMLQLRYATRVTRIRGICDRRAKAKMAKAKPTSKESSNAEVGITGVRATAWGEGTGGVNWGPSAAGGLFPQPGGIMHKPSGGRQRRRSGPSNRGGDRTTQPEGESRAKGLAGGVRGGWFRLA